MTCLTGANYRSRTLQDAFQVKTAKDAKMANCSATITAVTDVLLNVKDLSDTSSIVAALFPDGTLTLLENDLFDSNMF
jgi:hypothetical protein